MFKLKSTDMKSLLYSFIGVFALAIIGCSGDTDVPSIAGNPDPVEEGMMMEAADLEDAPDFSLATIQDGTVTLEDYKDKVLAIFFFGHNCPPCLSVGPTIETELNQEFRTKEDFAILGVDVWDGNTAQVEQFISTTSSTYPIALNGSAVGKDFDSGRDRLVVVTKDSKIAFNGTSVARNDLEEVQTIIRDLID